VNTPPASAVPQETPVRNLSDDQRRWKFRPFSRPRCVNISPRHAVVLPDGRTLVDVRFEGWGCVVVDNERLWFWRGVVVSVLVRVEEGIPIVAWNALGSTRVEIRASVTEARGPEVQQAPAVRPEAVRGPTPVVPRTRTRVQTTAARVVFPPVHRAALAIDVRRLCVDAAVPTVRVDSRSVVVPMVDPDRDILTKASAAPSDAESASPHRSRGDYP